MKTNEILEQLLDILSRETELYQAMSTVINKEKDAAIQSELMALNEAEIEKENILVALGLLEGQRCNLVTSLADTLGYPARDMSLTQISQLVGEPFADRLKQAKSDLSALLESVQAANQRNKHLFEDSRERSAKKAQAFFASLSWGSLASSSFCGTAIPDLGCTL